jgi:lysophospholipase L1-like esterase
MAADEGKVRGAETTAAAAPATAAGDAASAAGRERLVVCFGDSLTYGYRMLPDFSGTDAPTPYGRVLQALLGAAWRVEVAGEPGEEACEMVGRVHVVLRARPEFVVVLGGTNDLGMGARPTAVAHSLARIYDAVIAAGARPVAVTVPPFRPPRVEEEALYAEPVARRRELNSLIAALATERRVPLVDLHAAVSEPKRAVLRAEFCNDGLHFTAAGYRRFGETVFAEAFAPLLADGGKAAAARAPREPASTATTEADSSGDAAAASGPARGPA